MDYRKLLSRARAKIPKEKEERGRFEIPKVRGHIEGNKTIISNFRQIASSMNREPAHVLKYILKELAAPGELKKDLAIIGRKLTASVLNEKIEKYAKIFVLCYECGKPDTKLIKERGFLFLKCLACGAKHVVRI